MNNIISRYHATIFAYGQTGSGKTHTMDGLEYLIREKSQKKDWRDQPKSSNTSADKDDTDQGDGNSSRGDGTASDDRASNNDKETAGASSILTSPSKKRLNLHRDRAFRQPTVEHEGISLRCIRTLYDMIDQKKQEDKKAETETETGAGPCSQHDTNENGDKSDEGGSSGNELEKNVKEGQNEGKCNDSEADFEYTIRCSFMQIYQESVFDLLTHGKSSNQAYQASKLNTRSKKKTLSQNNTGLRVRWSPEKEFYVENLYIHQCNTPQEARDYFISGLKRRKVASHRLNASSSRSHSIFTLYVDRVNPRFPDTRVSSKLCLVDLAGSERVSMTGATGKVLKQSIGINKSLFVLRKVIKALASSSSLSASSTRAARQQRKHIPYRDSTLTRLLKHSLGGNCLTLMVACLCPSDRFADENFSTLNYAGMTKKISNKAVVNEDPKILLIRKLRGEIKLLRAMLSRANSAYYTGDSVHRSATGGMLQDRTADEHVGGGGVNKYMKALGLSVDDAGSERGGGQRSKSNSGFVDAQMDVIMRRLMHGDNNSDSSHGNNSSGSLYNSDSNGDKSTNSSASGSVGIGGDRTLQEKFVDSVNIIKELIGESKQVQEAYQEAAGNLDEFEFENSTLSFENQELRDRVHFLETVLLGDDNPNEEGEGVLYGFAPTNGEKSAGRSSREEALAIEIERMKKDNKRLKHIVVDSEFELQQARQQINEQGQQITVLSEEKLQFEQRHASQASSGRGAHASQAPHRRRRPDSMRGARRSSPMKKKGSGGSKGSITHRVNASRGSSHTSSAGTSGYDSLSSLNSYFSSSASASSSSSSSSSSSQHQQLTPSSSIFSIDKPRKRGSRKVYTHPRTRLKKKSSSSSSSLSFRAGSRQGGKGKKKRNSRAKANMYDYDDLSRMYGSGASKHSTSSVSSSVSSSSLPRSVVHDEYRAFGYEYGQDSRADGGADDRNRSYKLLDSYIADKRHASQYKSHQDKQHPSHRNSPQYTDRGYGYGLEYSKKDAINSTSHHYHQQHQQQHQSQQPQPFNHDGGNASLDPSKLRNGWMSNNSSNSNSRSGNNGSSNQNHRHPNQHQQHSTRAQHTNSNESANRLANLLVRFDQQDGSSKSGAGMHHTNDYHQQHRNVTPMPPSLPKDNQLYYDQNNDNNNMNGYDGNTSDGSRQQPRQFSKLAAEELSSLFQKRASFRKY